MVDAICISTRKLKIVFIYIFFFFAFVFFSQKPSEPANIKRKGEKFKKHKKFIFTSDIFTLFSQNSSKNKFFFSSHS